MLFSQKDEERVRPQCVRDAEARIRAEEAAMTLEQKETRYQRAVRGAEKASIYRR